MMCYGNTYHTNVIIQRIMRYWLIKQYLICPCSWGLHNEHLTPMKLACNDIVITLQHMQIKYKSYTGNTWNAPNRFVIISSFYLQYFSENNVNIFVCGTTNAYSSKIERIKGYLVHFILTNF